MKGLIAKVLAGACGTGLLALTGCCGTGCSYDNVVDPCYPQRYEAAAKREVNESMAPQMMNGHILDQSMWDEHFEAGTDKLTPGGLEHLKYLARRRPQADPVIFLQATQEVPYDPAHPDAYVKARAALNDKRSAAIQAFLGAYTSGAPVDFHVVVHDAAEPGQSSIGIARSVLQMHNSYQGSLATGGGGGSGGSGPASPAH